MARIRTIKPEFWSSPSVAKASAVSRLAFIALWNWADDHGRGTANLKELEGFIFPNDDVAKLSSGNTVNFRAVVAEVSECFGVLFYEVDGRPYFAIPSWDLHQRNERRAQFSKYPEPPAKQAIPVVVEEIPSQRTVNPHTSGPGTGEQGNREQGTGEQSFSSEIADATPRPDDLRPEVEAILDYLEAGIAANDAKVPVRGKKARTAIRLMLDRDGRTPDQIHTAIEYATTNEFWRSNILSAPKLREKFDQLRLQAQRSGWKPNDRHQRDADFWESEMASALILDQGTMKEIAS